jgi:hypothetical protein
MLRRHELDGSFDSGFDVPLPDGAAVAAFTADASGNVFFGGLIPRDDTSLEYEAFFARYSAVGEEDYTFELVSPVSCGQRLGRVSSVVLDSEGDLWVLGSYCFGEYFFRKYRASDGMLLLNADYSDESESAGPFAIIAVRAGVLTVVGGGRSMVDLDLDLNETARWDLGDIAIRDVVFLEGGDRVIAGSNVSSRRKLVVARVQTP